MGVHSDASLPEGLVVLERGWLSSNSVLLCGDDGAALVDSGYWTHSQQTVALVASALGARRLSKLVNTHLHSDHCGGNAALQACHPGLRTAIPPGLAHAVRDWDPVALTYVPTGQHCPEFVIHGVLQPGETERLGDLDWQVHAAPGHDPNSVVLFEPVSRTLISADALWQNGFGIVFQELEGERAFGEVASTLDMIEFLAPSVVVPGHGSVFTDIEAALRRARGRLEAYMANPAKHAAHAAKVLLKFKLLEIQHAEISDFLTWARETRYFELVRRRWFGDQPLEEWLCELLAELVRSGAAARQGSTVSNT